MSDEPDNWISVEEAAALSGYHPEHVRDLLRSGRVRGRKFARIIWQVNRAALLEYVERMRQRGEKPGRKPD